MRSHKWQSVVPVWSHIFFPLPYEHPSFLKILYIPPFLIPFPCFCHFSFSDDVESPKADDLASQIIYIYLIEHLASGRWVDLRNVETLWSSLWSMVKLGKPKPSQSKTAVSLFDCHEANLWKRKKEIVRIWQWCHFRMIGMHKRKVPITFFQPLFTLKLKHGNSGD